MLTVPSGGLDYVQLEPNTAVVSCERVKQAVLRELKLTDHWRDKIYLRLQPKPVGSDEEWVHVEAQPSASGWTYRVSMPEQLSKRRFVSTMVELTLLEIANRRAPEITAELPKWFGTGLAAGLEARGIGELVVDPFSQHSETQRSDATLPALRKHLLSLAALSLDELNWPIANPNPSQFEHYRLCAQLFVVELTRLDDGSQRLARMLQHLPDHLNWQITFLEAFAPRFKRLVDVDKWWSVTVANFIGRNQFNEMPASVALDQLTEILKVPVDIHVRSTQRTDPSVITLQRVVAGWDSSRLDPLLYKKLSQLEGLQLRAPKAIAQLALQYRDVLGLFLRQRNSAGGASTFKNEWMPNARVLVKKTVRQLEDLDRARVRLVEQTAHPVPSARADGATSNP